MEQNNIIKFHTIREENGKKLVSARELHEKLGVKRDFTTWIKGRIIKYDFIENEDFTTINIAHQNGGASHGGQNKVDYIINTNMAKELCMVENNEQGKKCRRYFINLEKEVKDLKEDKEELYNVAVSDKELAIREYEADKVKYALRNVKTLLLDCNYTNLETTVNKIIEVQTNLKKKDRYEYHKEMNDTEYKQYIREYVKNKLEKIMIEKQDIMLTMVAKTIQLQLESKAHTTTKRSTSHLISSKVLPLQEELTNTKKELEKQNPLLENMIDVPIHGLSNNYLYTYYKDIDRYVKTSTYKKWISDFEYLYELNQLTEKWEFELYEGIDFNKPCVLYLKYICKDELDVENFGKSAQDMIFNRILGVDDNIVHKVIQEKIGSCDSFDEGHIFFTIRNV